MYSLMLWNLGVYCAVTIIDDVILGIYLWIEVKCCGAQGGGGGQRSATYSLREKMNFLYIQYSINDNMKVSIFAGLVRD